MNLLKTNGIRFCATILFVFILNSCMPDPRYYNLSDESKEFLVYNLDDTFKLKNTETNEIISFTITTKELDFIEDGPNESPFIGVAADIYLERGFYRFTDSSNCYQGELTLIANRENSFDLSIYLYGDCFKDSYSYFEYENETISSININGTTYSNVNLFKRYQDSLFYSKEKGILKIVETTDFPNIREFIIVE